MSKTVQSNYLLESQILLIGISVCCKDTNHFIQTETFVFKYETLTFRDITGHLKIPQLNNRFLYDRVNKVLSMQSFP